jgi:hypothetical protein
LTYKPSCNGIQNTVTRRIAAGFILLMTTIITPEEAIKLGHTSITMPYNEKCETDMKWLRTVLRDMVGCRSSLVETPKGLEVWRHKKEINTLTQ